MCIDYAEVSVCGSNMKMDLFQLFTLINLRPFSFQFDYVSHCSTSKSKSLDVVHSASKCYGNTIDEEKFIQINSDTLNNQWHSQKVEKKKLATKVLFRIHLFALVSTAVQVVSSVIMSCVTLRCYYNVNLFNCNSCVRQCIKMVFPLWRKLWESVTGCFGQIACFNLINFATNIMTIIQITNFFRSLKWYA